MPPVVSAGHPALALFSFDATPLQIRCMADVAEGTGHCHDNGIVICDLKPSNVILVHDGSRYVGKVADFGLALGERIGWPCGIVTYSFSGGNTAAVAAPFVHGCTFQ